MSYILIIIITWGNAPTMTTATFDNKAACEAALTSARTQVATGWFSDIRGICVAKQ